MPKLAEYTPDGYSDAMEKRRTPTRSAARRHAAHLSGPRLRSKAGRAFPEISNQRLHSRAGLRRRHYFHPTHLSGQSSMLTLSQTARLQCLRLFNQELIGQIRLRREAARAVEAMEVEVGEIRMTPEAPFQEVKQAVDLSKADIIVAVGRGIKSKDNLALAEKLAEALGADLAASRPICDAEWLPIDRQIGSSGQTVAPKLYVALGISGAIQHLVGMKNSGTIVAINKDPEAPIFDIADYGIVGDLFEAVPVLTEEIKKIKAG